MHLIFLINVLKSEISPNEMSYVLDGVTCRIVGKKPSDDSFNHVIIQECCDQFFYGNLS